MAHSDGIPAYEPDEVTPGETAEWRKSLTDFSASEGWSLTYYFRNASGTGFNAAGTADGAGWLVSAAVPTNVEPGRLDWQAWVEKGGESHLADRGTMTAVVGFKGSPTNAPRDARTQAERDLDAVRAALVPATSAGVAEYEIANGTGGARRLKYFSKADLLALETRLAQRVNSERRTAKLRQGAPYFKNIYSR